MKFKTITIKDIAKALNLSASTVSKALHESHEISVETRNLVIAYAREHNYKPNPIAQSLKNGRSKSIGVILCHVDNEFFSQAINGMESIAHAGNYNVIITQSHDDPAREMLNIKHLISSSVDGLIISLAAGNSNIPFLQEINKSGFPIVFFDRVTNDIDTHKVVANNFKGAYDATQHLVRQGYNRIAHLTSSRNLSNTAERLAGYKAAMTDAGLHFPKEYIQFCEHGGMLPEEPEKALDILLSLPEPPDAIVTGADRLSIKTMGLLNKRNISIPEQMALAGFTNTVSADLFNPALSTVVQPAVEMGKQATEMLIHLIETKRPVTEFETRVLDTQLNIRSSSSKAKKIMI